jgi:hypothetical protein
MDPESRRLLEEIHALAKDNHRILRAVRRHQFLSSFGRLFFWIIVILISGYLYLVYLQPIAEKLIPGLSTTTPIGKLINSFTAGK